MSDYHLVFNVNQRYMFYLLVTCQSVLDSLEDEAFNSQDKLIFHFILDQDVILPKAQQYVQFFKDFNATVKVPFNVELHTIDVSEFANCDPFVRENIGSITTYLRLAFARFIPDDVDRVLYLDIDLLVRADVRKVFKQYPCNDEILFASTETSSLAYAEDVSVAEPKYVFKSKDSISNSLSLYVRDEIQAGVMLINVKQWRAQNIESKCLEIASKYKITGDQPVISIACKDRVAWLDWEWNITYTAFLFVDHAKVGFQNVVFALDDLPFYGVPTREQLTKMSQNPKIVHFAGTFKPWSLNCNTKPATLEKYKSFMPYCVAWLKTYERLSSFFKAQSH